MVKKNKLNLFVLIVLLILPTSFAACPEDPSCLWNKDAPEQFDYKTGDYSSIDWGSVVWNKIPPTRISDVPAEKLDYTQLNSKQRLATTTEQIALNLEKIDNLVTEVNEERAREAIEQVTKIKVVSLGQSAQVVQGVLKATFGEQESLAFAGKEGWEVEINEHGEINFLGPKELQENTISSADSFTVPEETTYTRKDGSVLSVKSLSFKNGQSYVKQGSTARVGFYEIPAESNAVEVYFNPVVKPEGNYVAISDVGLDIGTTKSGEVKVNPRPGNLLFNMVKRQYEHDAEGKPIADKFAWVPDERDTLLITVSGGDGLEVISRTEEGKTILVRHQNGGGKTSLENGRMEVNLKEGKLIVIPPKPFEGKAGPIDQRNSVAMELVSDSSADVFRTSSSNRFIALSNGKKIAGNNVGLEVSDLIEPNMIKSINDLRARYPKINFGFGINQELQQAYQTEGEGSAIPDDYTDISANIAQLFDEWLRDKPEIEKYIFIVNFNTGDNAAGTFNEVEFGERTADPAFVLQNPVRELEGPRDTMDHEFVHVLEKYIANKELNIITREITQYRLSEEFKTKEREFMESILAESQDLQQRIAQFDEETTKHIKGKVLDEQYARVVISLADRIYGSDRFDDLLIQSDELSQEIGKPARAQQFFQDATTQTDPDKKKSNANGIADLAYYLHTQSENKDNPPAAREKAKLLEEELKTIVERETALYPYSFKYRVSFAEASATYSELPPQRATKTKELAQLELDKVISAEPPSWLKQQAEERYYKIMGGKDGPYCNKNPCGPCLKYTLLCKQE